MNLKECTSQQLCQLYRGRQKLCETGAVGADDFDGLFRQLIDEQEAACPGRGVLNASSMVLDEIAGRWFEEQGQIDEMLSPGKELWYVDEETGGIEKAVVATVCYKDGVLDSFSAEFPESDDFDEFYGSAYGSSFFASEALARKRILKGFQGDGQR